MENKLIVKDKVGNEITLPDGKYFGMWTGFEIELRNNGMVYEIQLNYSIRSMNIPVDITIENGLIEFERINK